MVELDALHLALLGIAGAAAAAINAVAGGGGLLVFPALLAAGVPALHANVTGSVAAIPGLFSATWTERAGLRGQRARLPWALGAAPLAGVAGAWLLLRLGAQAFESVVPWLLLAATAVFWAGPRLKAALRARSSRADDAAPGESLPALAAVSVAAALYSGYFGAGLSVMLMAAFSFVLPDTLPRQNALRMALLLSAKAGAVAYLIGDGTHVVWPAAMALAAGGLVGGMLGGRAAGRIDPKWLRAAALATGAAASAYFFLDFG